jgi:hypothetical protein
MTRPNLKSVNRPLSLIYHAEMYAALRVVWPLFWSDFNKSLLFRQFLKVISIKFYVNMVNDSRAQIGRQMDRWSDEANLIDTPQDCKCPKK